MWRRHLFLTIILLIFILLQTSFGTAELWQGKINFILLFLIGCTFYVSLEYSLIWLVICGFLLDLFSHLNFGVTTVSLFIVIILIYFTAENLIRRNSWWSISLLMSTAVILFNLLITAISYFLWHLNFNYFFISFDIVDILYQIILNFIIIMIAYSFRNFFIKYLIIYEK